MLLGIGILCVLLGVGLWRFIYWKGNSQSNPINNPFDLFVHVLGGN